MNIILKPVTTEKAVRMIDIDNTLVFETSRLASKEDIRKTFEETFKSKVEKIRTSIKYNKKYVYLKLKKENPAIDIATKLGVI